MTRFQQIFAVLVLVLGYGVVGRMDRDDVSRAADTPPPTLRLECRDTDASSEPFGRPRRVTTVALAAPTRLSCVVVAR